MGNFVDFISSPPGIAVLVVIALLLLGYGYRQRQRRLAKRLEVLDKNEKGAWVGTGYSPEEADEKIQERKEAEARRRGR